MVNPQVRLDSTSLGAAEKLRGPLEDQLTSALNVAVDKVDDQYDGEDAGQVADDILEHTKAGLHSDIAAAVVPDEDQLRSVAETIVRDNT